MFYNGLATARQVQRATRWLTDSALWLTRQATRLEGYANRWVHAIDPGETGWMDE